jgi:uncharacterized protein (DUF1778 family)
MLELLDDIITAVEGAKSVPLSGNVMLDREEVLGSLRKLRDNLPEELRAARWMVREREAFVARTNEKARQLIEDAKARSKDLVADSFIVKEAVEEANRLVRNAETEGRRIRLEGEDVAESRLAEAETVLAELLEEVRASRGVLHEARDQPPEAPVSR